jgi:hypothetical protein
MDLIAVLHNDEVIGYRYRIPSIVETLNVVEDGGDGRMLKREGHAQNLPPQTAELFLAHAQVHIVHLYW